MTPVASGSSFLAFLIVSGAILFPWNPHGQILLPAPFSSFPYALTISPLYPQSSHTNSLDKLPFFFFFSETLRSPLPSELTRNYVLQNKSSKDAQIILTTYILLTKGEL